MSMDMLMLIGSSNTKSSNLYAC